MLVEIVLALLAGTMSMLAGGVAQSEAFEKLLRKLLKRPAPEPSHSQRLARLMGDLRQASLGVDSILRELAQVAADREGAVSELEHQLRTLEAKEQALQERIAQLESVPIPVAEYFAHLASARERRTARRDYMLFGAGVLVSTALSVLFFLIQRSR
jgi:uncharacterized protein (DUF3084 family)